MSTPKTSTVAVDAYAWEHVRHRTDFAREQLAELQAVPAGEKTPFELAYSHGALTTIIALLIEAVDQAEGTRR